MKHLLSIAFLFLFLAVSAQNDLEKPLPVDSKIRTGVLSNGMKYYIRKNAKPEKRAELRIAVNAGSTAENDDQQGLAHLTEHMAFNGTKNFKKSEIVDFLESVGTKFGAHLNAYTSFDETVYMIQLPTDSDYIVEKGLQILEDWAHNLSFDSIEVEKERGVVVEEWRLGQGADERMRRKYWPVLFKDSRYAERLPIGKKEIIEGCKQSTLRQFYADWYRPDLMAVIAVGDFDIDKMEKTIKQQFSKLKVSPNARPIKSWEVPDNKELAISTATDAEARFARINIYWKQPIEIQKTEGDYRKSLAQSLYSGMLNARMAELQRSSNPPFMFAFGGFSDMVRTKASYEAGAVCKEDGIERAIKSLIDENERVRRFGFTATELARQKTEMMSGIEAAYKERDKTESRSFTDEYIRNFLQKEPIPGIEYEYELHKKYLDGIKLEEVNAFASKWITDGTNAVVTITAPQKETLKLPSEDYIKNLFKTMRAADLKAYKDNVVNKPLVDKAPAPSKVAEVKEVKEMGITEWKLANGARVILKPTDFKNDEILFSAVSWGGTSTTGDKDYMAADYSTDIINESGLGNFDKNTLEKYLSGKIANVSSYINELQEGLNGSCAPKDLETMLQLAYQYFNAPRLDTSAFSALIKRQEGFLSNKNSDPNSIFRDTISYAWSGYNYRYRPLSVDILHEIKAPRAYDLFRQRFNDASNFTFFFVGRFKPEELKPLVEKYIGGLPSTHRDDTWKDIGIVNPKGTLEKFVKKGVEPKSSVVMRFSMPFTYNRNNRNEVTALQKLINIKLRESLREDKSGVYGVNCNPNIKHYPKEALEQTINFTCAPGNVDMLVKAALDVIDDIKKNGADDKNLTKIKELSLRERESGLKENGFWLSAISSNYMNGEDITELLKYNAWVNSLKGDDFKKFAEKYLQQNNYAKFVLNPEK